MVSIPENNNIIIINELWIPFYRAAPIPGICISIGPIPVFLMVLKLVKYVIQVPLLLTVP